MKTNRILILLVTLVALVVPGVASASGNPALAHEAHQWSFGTSAPLRASTTYTITNLVNGSPIGYESRVFGPDLGWNTGHWQLVPWAGSYNTHDHRTSLVTPGTRYALYNTDRKRYLIYNENTTGINLGWANYASYQWMIDQGSTGVSLNNTVEGDYVVYGVRSFGINLMWLKDLIKQDAVNAPGAMHDASVFMQAQPPYSGPIPYLGYYGGGVSFNGVLTKVTNPYSNVALKFILPGHSSEQCDSDDATTVLGPNQTMTAAQMQMLWGAAQPNLAQRLPFLACVAGTASSSVFVNIQWRSTAGVSPLTTHLPSGALSAQTVAYAAAPATARTRVTKP